MIDAVCRLAQMAGEAIMAIYQQEDFDVRLKSDDSPLTDADHAANDIIVAGLASFGLPILSEESKLAPFEERRQWQKCWIVDPLDGTKEFIKRNGEFTVNIALVEDGLPVFGVVYAPAMQWLYWGGNGIGAWKKEGEQAPKPIAISKAKAVGAIAASRSHITPETHEFISQFPNAELVNLGSSLKLMLVAEGKADIYPRFGPTMEWDIAASHAIVDAAGGRVWRYEDQKPLAYNKENLLNPWFVADGRN